MLDSNLIARARAVDLLALAGRYTNLKRVALTGGGEYAGPCPICGGRDRFRVQPKRGRWLCRGCTDRWEDAIAFEMRLTRATFPEAVRALVGGAWPMISLYPPPPESVDEPPNALWQKRASAVIGHAARNLWSTTGRLARAWLRARGLTDATLHQWRIGYIPKSRREPSERWGLRDDPVYVPSGVVIPGEVAGQCWYLKVRRLSADADPKYLQVRGSRPALYLAGTLDNAHTICAAEGEFDALLLWQCLQGQPDLRGFGVVTLGGQTHRLRPRWAEKLDGKRLLLFFDQDRPGQQGAQAWLQRHPNAINVCWPALRPADKDLTDHHLSGGDLCQLVRAAL